MPRVWIVTGSSGFLGTEVCTQMSNLGFEVIGIDRKVPLYLPKWQTVKSEFADFTNHLKFPKNKKFGVIHCAALKTVTDSNLNGDEFMYNNIEKSISLFQSAHEAGCRNFVFVSSAAVYEESEHRLSELNPTYPKSVYGLTKLLFENHLKEQKLYRDSSVIIIRPFNIIGRNTLGIPSESVVTRILKCITNDDQFILRTGPNNQAPVRDYIDVKDVARLVTFFSKNQKTGIEIINACTGVGINLSSLIEKCENILSRKLHSERENLSELEILNSTGDPRSAKSRFGWTAVVTLEESIKREIAST